MQPVNDDMDNLFRRAAEDYPLHTHGANFDKVRQQMDMENPLPEKEKKSRKYLWLLLLLLIPIPFLYRHFQAPSSTATGKGNQQIILAKQETPYQDNTNSTSTNTASPQKTNITETTDGFDKENEKEKNNALTVKPATETPTENTQAVSNDIPEKAVVTIRKQNAVSDVKKPQNKEHKHLASTLQPTKNTKPQQGNENFFASAYSKKVAGKNGLPDNKKETEDSSWKLLNTAPAIAIQKPDIVTNNKVKDSLPTKNTATQATNSTTLTKVDKQNREDTTTLKNTATKNKNQKKPGVYIGVAAGPDYSTVKSNKSNGPGYNVGFIAGYQTGSHLAFETGLLWNYKKYYSDGKYVNPEKIYLPSHTQVMYLNGTCGIIEIPVSIRYHFNSKGRSNLYAGTGVSSYIMKKEDYYYKYKRYNTEYYGEKEYKNSSKNWFSVLQFNVGYQLNLHKWGNLRVEPYIKLPVHGIGIGNLPLSGGGINAGYTLPIR